MRRLDHRIPGGGGPTISTQIFPQEKETTEGSVSTSVSTSASPFPLFYMEEAEEHLKKQPPTGIKPSILTREVPEFFSIPKEVNEAINFFHRELSSPVTLEYLDQAWKHFSHLPEALHSEALSKLKTAAFLVRKKIESNPHLPEQLRGLKILSEIHHTLCSQGSVMEEDLKSLTDLLKSWLKALESKEVKPDLAVRDMIHMIQIAKSRGLSELMEDSLKEGFRNLYINLKYSENADPREARHTRHLLYLLLRDTDNTFGNLYKKDLQKSRDALFADADQLAREEQVASDPFVRLQKLGELAQLMQDLYYPTSSSSSSSPLSLDGRGPGRGWPVVHSSLSPSPQSPPVEGGEALKEVFTRILEIAKNPSLPISLRTRVIYETAHQMIRNGDEKEGLKILKDLHQEGVNCLREAKESLTLIRRFELLEKADQVFQQVGTPREQTSVRKKLREVLITIRTQAENEPEGELKRTLLDFVIRNFLRIGDYGKSQGTIDRLWDSVLKIPILSPSPQPSPVEGEGERKQIEHKGLALLQVAQLYQQVGHLGAFYEVLKDIEALGIKHNHRTIKLYPQWIRAILKNDHSKAEQLYNELQPPTLGKGGWGGFNLPPAKLNSFQLQAILIHDRYEKLQTLERTAPTIQWLRLMIEGNYTQRIAHAKDENLTIREENLVKEQEKMRGYLTEIQGAILSGKAKNTRKAIAALGKEKEKEFFEKLEKVFEHETRDEVKKGHLFWINHLIDSERIADPNKQAIARLSIARRIIDDDKNQRCAAMLASIFVSLKESGQPGMKPPHLMESLHRINSRIENPDDFSHVWNWIAQNDTLLQQVEATETWAPYHRMTGEIFENIFTVEGGAITLLSLFTAGLAAELAGGAMVARLGIQSVQMASFGQRLAIGGVSFAAEIAALNATGLSLRAGLRFLDQRRQMTKEEITFHVLGSVFSLGGGHITTAPFKAFLLRSPQFAKNHPIAVGLINFALFNPGMVVGGRVGKELGLPHDGKTFMQDLFHTSLDQAVMLGALSRTKSIKQKIVHGVAQKRFQKELTRLKPAVEETVKALFPEGSYEPGTPEAFANYLLSRALKDRLNPQEVKQRWGNISQSIDQIAKENGYGPEHILHSLFRALLVESALREGWDHTNLEGMRKNGIFKITDEGLKWESKPKEVSKPQTLNPELPTPSLRTPNQSLSITPILTLGLSATTLFSSGAVGGDPTTGLLTMAGLTLVGMAVSGRRGIFEWAGLKIRDGLKTKQPDRPADPEQKRSDDLEQKKSPEAITSTSANAKESVAPLQPFIERIRNAIADTPEEVRPVQKLIEQVQADMDIFIKSGYGRPFGPFRFQTNYGRSATDLAMMEVIIRDIDTVPLFTLSKRFDFLSDLQASDVGLKFLHDYSKQPPYIQEIVLLLRLVLIRRLLNEYQQSHEVGKKDDFIRLALKAHGLFRDENFNPIPENYLPNHVDLMIRHLRKDEMELSGKIGKAPTGGNKGPTSSGSPPPAAPVGPTSTPPTTPSSTPGTAARTSPSTEPRVVVPPAHAYSRPNVRPEPPRAIAPAQVISASSMSRLPITGPTTVQEFGLSDQMVTHSKSKVIEPEKIQGVINSESPASNKPLSGGLWTASHSPEERSDWVNFARRTYIPIRSPDAQKIGSSSQWTLLTPRPDAKIFVVDSLESFQKLIQQYGRQVSFDNTWYQKIDFEALSRDFDALHITKRGLEEVHEAFSDDHDETKATLHGWDVEQTLWFRWAFEEAKPQGTVPKEWVSRPFERDADENEYQSLKASNETYLEEAAQEALENAKNLTRTEIIDKINHYDYQMQVSMQKGYITDAYEYRAKAEALALLLESKPKDPTGSSSPPPTTPAGTGSAPSSPPPFSQGARTVEDLSHLPLAEQQKRIAELAREQAANQGNSLQSGVSEGEITSPRPAAEDTQPSTRNPLAEYEAKTDADSNQENWESRICVTEVPPWTDPNTFLQSTLTELQRARREEPIRAARKRRIDANALDTYRRTQQDQKESSMIGSTVADTLVTKYLETGSQESLRGVIKAAQRNDAITTQLINLTEKEITETGECSEKTVRLVRALGELAKTSTRARDGLFMIADAAPDFTPTYEELAKVVKQRWNQNKNEKDPTTEIIIQYLHGKAMQLNEIALDTLYQISQYHPVAKEYFISVAGFFNQAPLENQSSENLEDLYQSTRNKLQDFKRRLQESTSHTKKKPGTGGGFGSSGMSGLFTALIFAGTSIATFLSNLSSPKAAVVREGAKALQATEPSDLLMAGINNLDPANPLHWLAAALGTTLVLLGMAGQSRGRRPSQGAVLETPPDSYQPLKVENLRPMVESNYREITDPEGTILNLKIQGKNKYAVCVAKKVGPFGVPAYEILVGLEKATEDDLEANMIFRAILDRKELKAEFTHLGANPHQGSSVLEMGAGSVETRIEQEGNRWYRGHIVGAVENTPAEYKKLLGKPKVLKISFLSVGDAPLYAEALLRLLLANHDLKTVGKVAGGRIFDQKSQELIGQIKKAEAHFYQPIEKAQIKQFKNDLDFLRGHPVISKLSLTQTLIDAHFMSKQGHDPQIVIHNVGTDMGRMFEIVTGQAVGNFPVITLSKINVHPPYYAKALERFAIKRVEPNFTLEITLPASKLARWMVENQDAFTPSLIKRDEDFNFPAASLHSLMTTAQNKGAVKILVLPGSFARKDASWNQANWEKLKSDIHSAGFPDSIIVFAKGRSFWNFQQIYSMAIDAEETKQVTSEWAENLVGETLKARAQLIQGWGDFAIQQFRQMNPDNLLHHIRSPQGISQLASQANLVPLYYPLTEEIAKKLGDQLKGKPASPK
jgi:hypothetical protein